MIDTTIFDTSPRGLADALDALVLHLDADREVAAALADCRERLRAIGYNRWAHRVNRRSMARSLRRRHQRRWHTG
jgi:hypothetical protein